MRWLPLADTNRSVSTLAFLIKGNIAARTGLLREESSENRGEVFRTVVVVFKVMTGAGGVWDFEL